MLNPHNEKKKNIACAIFAGGQNRRMGRHKAFLDCGGRKFIEAVYDNMAEWFADIFIVTNDKSLFRGTRTAAVYEDIVPGKGPIGALHTALTVAGEEKVFCTACDMPFSNRSVTRKLIRASEKEDFDCFVPRGKKGADPLFAIYRKTVKDLALEEITSGQLRLSEMLNKCRTYYMDMQSEEEKLVNINTPEDYTFYADKIEGMDRKER